MIQATIVCCFCAGFIYCLMEFNRSQQYDKILRVTKKNLQLAIMKKIT